MGRGDNRRSPKHRRRKAWRRMKRRLAKKMEVGKASKPAKKK